MAQSGYPLSPAVQAALYYARKRRRARMDASSGPVIPANAVKHNGEVVTHNGETVTYG